MKDWMKQWRRLLVRVGLLPPGGAALHRGQRHPATAPEPGAGGGAAGAHRGGGRPQGADRT